MAKGKTADTLPDGKRFSLKRADIFMLGRLIEESSEEVPGGRAYKLGQSDQTVAAAALEKLKMPIEPEALAKIRKQLLGAFVTDKGGIRGQLDSLRQEVAAIRKQLIEQGKLLAALRQPPTEQPRRISDHHQSGLNGSRQQ